MSNSTICIKVPRGARKAEQEAAKAQGLKTFMSAWPCPKGHAEFYTSGKGCSICAAQRSANWYGDNRDNALARMRIWALNNPDKVAESERKWIAAHPERRDEIKRNWAATNPNKVRENRRKWNKANPEILFLRQCLKRVDHNFKASTYETLLGYSAQDLRTHLESLWSEGMTWENRKEWHIDHILSIAWMKRKGITDPKLVNALANLRPLWAAENLRKSDKWDNEEHGQMTFLSVLTRSVYGMAATEYLNSIKEVA